MRSRRSYDVHVELPTQATIVLVVGLADTAKALRRLAGDIEETVKRIARPGTTAAIVGPARMLLGEMAVPPRDAFLGEAEVVAVGDAVGRISCESIASYPPGVPQLLPGERISAEIVAHLTELARDRGAAPRRQRPPFPDDPRAAGGAMRKRLRKPLIYTRCSRGVATAPRASRSR